VLSSNHFHMYAHFLGNKPAYRFEYIRDLIFLNLCVYVTLGLLHPHIDLKLWHKPSLHHKTLYIPKYLHTEKSQFKTLLSLIKSTHNQVPTCILSFRSNESIITHYMQTWFRSNYSWNIHHLHTHNTLIFIFLYILALRKYHMSKPY